MSDESSSIPQTLYQAEPGASQILLVRHGQSIPYVPGEPFALIDGHGDPPLTELGHHQARLVGARLADEPVAAIYTSTLTRTKQTAAPLAERLGLRPVTEADLREVFLGDFEGGLFRQMDRDGHPAVDAMRSNREWGEIPGAETNAALTERSMGALERIAAAHREELVVAVCHGGVIGAVLSHIAGAAPFTFNRARHTSINHLVRNPSGWVIRTFNDGAHVGTLNLDHPLS